MQGVKDLFASERGIFAIVLSLASTALVIVGKLEIQQWIDFNKWIGTVLIASKTVTTAIDMLRKPAAPADPPLPTATSVGQPPPSA